ncbi:MAG: hypothetical protein ACR2KT_18460 [Methylocella sp.]
MNDRLLDSLEIMQRSKDVILGEDGTTNRSDNAPRNVFSLASFVRKILKPVSRAMSNCW